MHLVRDINDDVLKHPLDIELKSMARDFGVLLRAIVETVDIRGLKSRYSRKYKRPARRFLKSVASTDLTSPLADKYKKRFQKSGEKMFTFLDHDGVPWNNNNAEHAIKPLCQISQGRRRPLYGAHPRRVPRPRKCFRDVRVQQCERFAVPAIEGGNVDRIAQNGWALVNTCLAIRAGAYRSPYLAASAKAPNQQDTHLED